ncbi:unnamed protein product [Meloidogyne enterolobii]|uniref:Uncharacterized protein n=1 Tax=Meloidogyne enterolobii TaxID=390850 RepID=A0ACB0XZ83_MELEN
MNENQQQQQKQQQSIYNIQQPEKREKPQILKKPIPKPRRRITIGSGDNRNFNLNENKNFNQINNEQEQPQQNNTKQLITKRLITFGENNNSPPYAPQLPRKILKSGSVPILQPKNQQKISNQKEKQLIREIKKLKISPPQLKPQQQQQLNKINETRNKPPRRENFDGRNKGEFLI